MARVERCTERFFMIPYSAIIQLKGVDRITETDEKNIYAAWKETGNDEGNKGDVYCKE